MHIPVEKRSKAAFRAWRESLGLPINELAADLGMDYSTKAINWERPSNDTEPPDEAWEVLERYERQAEDAVAAALADPPETLTYYFAGAQWRKAGHEDATGCSVYNARARRVGTALLESGHPVRIVYPDSGDVSMRRQPPRPRRGRPVRRGDGKVFVSTAEAGRAMGLSREAIRQAAESDGHRTAGGWSWEWLGSSNRR